MLLKNILLCLFIILSIDSIYLYFIKTLFEKHISAIQNSALKINMHGAIICYIFLAIGLNYFIISANKGPIDAFILGLVIYGVFESTSLALFKKWPYYFVLIDTLWGGVLLALATYIIVKINKIK